MAGTNISRANGSGSATTKFTLSMWIKRGSTDTGRMFSATGGSGDVYFRFNAGGVIEWSGHGSNASSAGYFLTNRLFRDFSSWYHFVIRFDSTQASASDRLRFYVNGTQEESFSTYTDVNQNATDNISLSSNTHYWGGAASSQYFDGMMTHLHYSNGYSYGPDTFGETDTTSGIWKPKTAPSLTYGSQGYFLKFENSGAMGTDSSGNSNTFTVANGTLTQQSDTPSNVFAALNNANVGGGASTLTNSCLTYTRTDYSHNARSTLGFTKGKWYWEQKQSDNSTRIGLITSGFSNNLDTDSTDAYYGTYANGGVYNLLSNSGTSWQRTNNDTSRSVDTYTSAIGSSAGDILMGAVDADSGKLWIGVNGVWMNSGDPAAGSNNQITFTNSTPDELQVYAGFGTSSSRTSNFNFGSGFFGTTAVTSANADANGLGAFEYTVPSGYYAICTKNIKEFG